MEQAPIDTLFPQCQQHGVGIIIGGPLNSGILAGRDTFNYGAIPPEVAQRVRAIDAVCRSHGVPLQRAALQFVAAHPLVVSVIPGPQSVQELMQNVQCFDADIPAALWDELKQKNLIHPLSPTPGALVSP